MDLIPVSLVLFEQLFSHCVRSLSKYTFEISDKDAKYKRLMIYDNTWNYSNVRCYSIRSWRLSLLRKFEEFSKYVKQAGKQS